MHRRLLRSRDSAIVVNEPLASEQRNGHATEASFETLGLPPGLLKGLVGLSHGRPTTIQAAVIPSALAGRDVWACAKTGSGKTAAYLLPVLATLSRNSWATANQALALVLAPTRELVAQIAAAARGYATYLLPKPRIRAVFGGVSINPQMLELRAGVELLIATPGRLLDLIGKNAVSLSGLRTLVLDEADRLLATGFTEELQTLLTKLPAQRQTMLHSATFAPAVERLARQLLRSPMRVDLTVKQPPPAISERIILVDSRRRTELLLRLLHDETWEQVLVFVAKSASGEQLAKQLRAANVSALALHGDLSQAARTQALTAFREQQVRVVVATDLASRGLDIAGLPAVINYDLPRSPTDYLHRIGRTGRAEAPGMSVSFVTANERSHLAVIEKRLQRTFQPDVLAGFEPRETAPAPRVDAGVGGIKGKRKSKKDKLREAAQRLGATPAATSKLQP